MRGGDHICIQQTGLAGIRWSSRQRARHSRIDLGCLFFLRAVSRWLGWTSRGTMTQSMREIVKVSDTCTGGGHALQDQPYAPHRRHSLDASGLSLQYHTFQQHRPACYTRASRWVRVVRPRQKSWLLSLPNASREHLSSCIQQFAIVMLGDARTKIDNARHAAEKADTTSGVWRNVAWSLPKRTRHYSAEYAALQVRVFLRLLAPANPSEVGVLFFGIFLQLRI